MTAPARDHALAQRESGLAEDHASSSWPESGGVSEGSCPMLSVCQPAEDHASAYGIYLNKYDDAMKKAGVARDHALRSNIQRP
eukprot:3522477-Karenia_brevis.AAC.1